MSSIYQLNTDNFKAPPPLSVHQDSLHVFPTLHSGKPTRKTFHLAKALDEKKEDDMDFFLSEQRFERTCKHKIICVTDGQVLESRPPTTSAQSQNYDPQFKEVDVRLRKVLKNAVVTSFSPSGRFLGVIQSEGDITLYSIESKALYTLKGVQRFEGVHLQETLQLLINDDASVLVIKNKEQDFAWMWSQSKDQYLQHRRQGSLSISNEPDGGYLMRQIRKNTGLFRSSSSDRAADKILNPHERHESQVQNSEPLQLKGTWMRLLLKEVVGNPQNIRAAQVPESFDLRFDSQKYPGLISEQIRMFQVKLYSKREYFGISLRPQIGVQTMDEEMIIEMTSLHTKINNSKRGGNIYEATQYTHNLKSKISAVEFLGGPLSSQKIPSILTKLDSSSSLSFTVLNSPHMLYCQAMFTSFDTSLSVVLKLFDFVQPDDCPSFDTRGKTNLCIDDASWTSNDAFVILIFNSFTFAVLPRLGKSLIAIFNPTLQNISQTAVELNQQYRGSPRTFNELILPIQVVQKHSQIKQQILMSRKQIVMAPRDETFVVTDGSQVCFTFHMQFQPELSELFGKVNMSYYFVRFCVSLERLVVDPEILEKIPQMLTNKLPLFEFEKNAELDEQEDPGQLIMTASQINPYEHGMKQMETNQSFNADFTLDAQVVLVNLKHLLMSLRWNKSSPINYFQWIVTVVNDCFFYFLKSSEPIYAYHALRIGEAYCKKVLFSTDSDQGTLTFEESDAEFHSERTDFTDFSQMKRLFQPVNDMYDYHNTKEYMKKSTVEKLDIKYSFFDCLPLRLLGGSGNWRFQFTKNYALLVYYSLIQFRNYQAANFNILFLVFSCYIMQRYLDSMFSQEHLSKIIEIVHRNFMLKKKSDDYELFLGKSGKNLIMGPAEKHKAYKDWVNLVLKFNLEHFSKSFGDQENYDVMLDTCMKEVRGEPISEKNVGFLEWPGMGMEAVSLMKRVCEGSEVFERVCEKMRNMSKLSESYKTERCMERAGIDFNYQSSFYVIAETLRCHYLEKQSKTLSVTNFVITLQKLLVKSGYQDSTNLLSNFSCHLDPSFRSTPRVPLHHPSLPTSQATFRELLSVCFLHLNDLDKASSVFPTSADPSPFKLFLFVTCLKTTLSHLDTIQDIDQQHFMSRDQIDQFQLRSNCLQTTKRCLGIIKEDFKSLYMSVQMGTSDKSTEAIGRYRTIAATMMGVPVQAQMVMREELMHHAVKQMSKVVKYVKLQVVNGSLREDGDECRAPSLAKQFLAQHLGEVKIEALFGSTKLAETFYHFLTLALLAISSLENHTLTLLVKPDLTISEKYTSTTEDTQSNLAGMLVRSVRKLAKVIRYLEVRSKLDGMDKQIQLLVTAQAIENHEDDTREDSRKMQIEYVETLVVVAQFEKYANSQVLLCKGLGIVRQVMMQPESLAQEEKIGSIIKMIQFSSLNRANKQKMASIMETVKQHGKSSYQNLLSLLENVMFQTQETSVTSTQLFNDYLSLAIPPLLQSLSTFTPLSQHLIASQSTLKHHRLSLLSHASLLSTLLGVSFTSSFFFDKTTFARRTPHILGLTDQHLTNYQILKQQQLDSQLKQKLDGNDEDQEHQMSFRDGKPPLIVKAEDDHQGWRHYEMVLESPRAAPMINPMQPAGRGGHARLGSQGIYRKKSPIGAPNTTQQPNAGVDLSKFLMRNRQMGQPGTPVKQRKEIEANIQSDLQKLKNHQKGMLVVPHNRRQESQVPDPSQIYQVQNKRKDSVDFDSKVTEMASIPSAEVDTRRKNSLRRQIQFLPLTQPQPQTQPKNHRKGQMSMAVGGAGSNPAMPRASFNFGNQKNLPPQIPKPMLAQGARSGPPPGIPKASPLPNKQSQTRTRSREEILSNFLKIVKHAHLRLAFCQWRGGQSTPIVQDRAKVKQNSVAAPFSLLLVKKEGNSYSVQELREILEKKRVELPAQVPMQPAPEIGAKPFEFVSIKPIDGKLVDQKPQKKPSKSGMTKEQKLMIIKKFKQISDKLDRVQREADSLTQTFNHN